MKYVLALIALVALPMSNALAQTPTASGQDDDAVKQESGKKSGKKSKKAETAKAKADKTDKAEGTEKVAKADKAAKAEKTGKKSGKKSKKAGETTTEAPAGDAAEATLVGYLIDKHCADAHAADLGHSAGHDTACVRKCVGTGSPLGMVADGKFYAFDAASQAKAAAALKASKSKTGVRVQVTGTRAGDEVVIASITESAPAT
jgi:hypothetical protein